MSKAELIVATFIAEQEAGLSPAVIARALDAAELRPVPIDWLSPDHAADVFFVTEGLAAVRDAFASALVGDAVDFIVQPALTRRKRLLVADMDSTMIQQECLDELADNVGLRPRVAEITARAMAGEIDFEAALKERVALLAGVTEEKISQTLARITLTPGARALVATMRTYGAKTALVSGGFTHFTQLVAQCIGFHEAYANRLEMIDGVLTGRVISPVQGCEAKRQALESLRVTLGISTAETLAVGDGANDLDMLRAAGLGIAFHAKPKVAKAVDARIDHADLTALLFAQGYRRGEILVRKDDA